MGEESEAPTTIVVTSIRPNSHQPRRNFDEDALSELAMSIAEVGVLLPLIVRPVTEGQYELIAGERRLRAAQIAGLAEVPVIVRSASEQDSLELALIENVQRENISAIECAHAYKQLAEKFSLNQEDIAKKVGKSRSAVANTLRLLALPDHVQRAISDGVISEGHGRALLMEEDPDRRQQLFETILQEGISVREAERLAKTDWEVPQDQPKGEPKPKHDKEADPHWHALERKLSETFGSPVTLKAGPKGGRMIVEFYSEEEFQQILDRLGVEL
ncbi:MAG TPA: ParB/RepB/Spo0J family partition protein [Fimbriimonadaceae bacterium]|nr:ParB/RepB/Spo0J family partition protein [Fimbriimonadaceae bacterium]